MHCARIFTHVCLVFGFATRSVPLLCPGIHSMLVHISSNAHGLAEKGTKSLIKSKAVWASCRFSQKTNERICFLCREKQKSKQNKFVWENLQRVNLLAVLFDLYKIQFFHHSYLVYGWNRLKFLICLFIFSGKTKCNDVHIKLWLEKMKHLCFQ